MTMLFRYSIFSSLELLLVLLSRVWAQNTTYYYKVGDKETFELDYNSWNQIVRVLALSVDLPVDPSFNLSNHPIQKNFNIEDYLIQSISPNDCRTMTNLTSKVPRYYSGGQRRINPDYPYMTKGNVIRVLNIKDNTIFMVNVYPSGRVMFPLVRDSNIVQVLSIKYNATHINEIKEVDSLLLKYDLVVHGQYYPSLCCLWADHIVAYEETVYLCLRYNSTLTTESKTQLVFYRPKQQKQHVIGDFISSKLWFSFFNEIDIDTFQALVSPTEDETFEVLAYVPGQQIFWSFTFGANDVYNRQRHALQYPIISMNYSCRLLLMIQTRYFDLATKRNQEGLSYLERKPGSASTLSNLQHFSDSKPLRVHYSSESIEVVIEAFKYNQLSQAGHFPTVHSSIYSYNLLTKEMKQT